MISINKLIPIVILIYCFSIKSEDSVDFLTSNSINKSSEMIVEIPAGTNKKYEYNFATKSFEIEIINKKERIINFLPYPANYGFIPSTKMLKSLGGDGDAIDILLISESARIGTVIEFIPIAILVLEDGGEKDSKIIGVPLDESLRIISAVNYQQLNSQYPAVKYVIQEWFLNYKGRNLMRFIKWDDELAAMDEIEKWKVKN